MTTRPASKARRLVASCLTVLSFTSLLVLSTAQPAHAFSTFIFFYEPLQPVIAGSTAELAFTTTNDGPDPAEDVSIEFTLPAGLTYAGDNHGCSVAGQVVTCSLFAFTEMDPGQSQTVILTVNVDAAYVADNGGGAPTAEANVGISIGYDGGSQSKTIGVTVGEQSDLRILKYVNEPTPNAGDIINYSIVVDNLGPSVARTVTIRDTLFQNFGPSLESPVLSINSCAFSVSQGGGIITQFTCSTGSAVATQFGNDIGTFGTDSLDPIGLYDDGAGGTVVGGRLRANFRMTALQHLTLDNEARVFSETVDPDNSNNLSSVFVEVTSVADLALDKEADLATASVGDEIEYTLTATNDGPSDAINTVITDHIPEGVTVLSASVPGGIYLFGTPGDIEDPLTCLLGTVPRVDSTTSDPPPNFKVATVTVRVDDETAVGSWLVNRAWVGSDVLDLNNANDADQTITEVVEPDHLFNPVTPSRQFDTRDGTGGVPIGKIPAGGTLAFTVTGVNDIPVGAAAVSLNVTVDQPEGEGYVTVFPCASPQPLASNLNFLPGQTVANAVIAPVDPAGEVCFFSLVETHLISDVSGWFRASSGLTTMNPVREFDTRDGTGGVGVGPRPAGSTLTFKVAGVNGVPAAGVGAVALNVTATQTGGDGHITVFPCGAQPLASNLNFTVDQTVPNLVVAPVSPQGNVCFFTTVATHLLADVSGWFEMPSELHPLNPTRVFDTRNGLGGVDAEPLLGGSHLEITVAGKNGVPLDGAGAVILNLTAVNSSAFGYVTAYPCGDLPLTSNVNLALDRPVPNTVIAPLSPWGTVCFYTNVDTDLLADVSGWFEGPPV
jgi:uncharacterized repeat protein (TIGR01451 family)